MSVRLRIVAWVVLWTAGMACGQTIQLTENASVTGKILAEKTNVVLMDLGFDVVSIPRTHIVRIITEEKAAAEPAVPAETGPAKDTLFEAASGGRQEKSVRELVEQLGEAVVQVRTPSGLGSGFILSEEGYLITNFHVIEGETQIAVEVYHMQQGQLDRKTYKEIQIVAMNKFQDLALLRISDEKAPAFAKVVLGDPDKLAVGERVFAIGSPLGLERTVTEGIVSTKTREFQGALYLQTTTQINPGNSGGPLFNLRGEVVGVTNMKLNFAEGLTVVEGIGFAIPVEALRYFLKYRDAFAYDNDNPSNPYRYLHPPSRLLQSADQAKEGGK